MAVRTITCIIFILSFAILGFSQQTACTKDIPVGAISGSGDSFRGLTAADFSGHIAKTPVAVKTVTFDDGPRRILIVMENGNKVSGNSKKAEAQMLSTMLESGRPEDSFGLILTHGTERAAKFGEQRAKLNELLSREADAKGGKEIGVLDAIAEGIDWFGAPQPGDAIIVVAVSLDGRQKTNHKAVAKALEEHHIRMFGFAMGPVATGSSVASGTITSTTSQGFAEARPATGSLIYDTGDETFFPLTANSGGLVLGISASTLLPNMDDPKNKQLIVQRARVLVGAATNFYRVQIDPPQLSRPEDWVLEVREGIKKIAPQMYLLYPRRLGPC
ncbi:MAG TPA: hypothetical protein VEW69_04545 [Alphaproteobacteria bacterium]|nr:hypothetical protein [Alphaproteobacteria bacterium]